MRKSLSAILSPVIVILCLFLFNTLNAQNVGIGTAAPEYRLHVNGDAASASDILYSRNNYAGDLDIIAVNGYSVANPGYGFGVQGTGGSIGVLGSANATSYTGTAYGVRGTASGTAGTRVGLYGSATGGTVANWAGYFASGNVYIQNKLGIGLTSPQYTVHATGTATTTGFFENTSAGGNGVVGAGTNTAGSGTGVAGYGGNTGVRGQANSVGAGNRIALDGFAAGGTADNYAVKGSAIGGTNAYGIYVAASGASSANWAGYFWGGNVYVKDMVGIGTNTPLYPLDVTSNKTRTANFINTASSQNYYGVYASTNNTPDYGYGMVGYGGSTGVYGNASLAGGNGPRYGVKGYAMNGLISNYGVWGSGTGGSSPVGVYGEATGGSTANWAGFFADGNVYVKNKVGIGTLIPSLAQLQVQGAVGNTVAMFSANANSQGVSVVSDWPGIHFNSYYNGGTKAMAASGFASNINTDQSLGGLTFNTTNIANTIAGGAISVNERMRITGDGKVGIGTTTPDYPLEVKGNLSRTGSFINLIASTNYTGLYGQCSATPGYGYGMQAYGGWIGIYAAADYAGAGDRYGVRCVGAGGAGSNYGIYAAAGTWAGYFEGPVHCSSGVWTSSDRKLKNDINPLNGALSIINQLRPSVYTFKTNEYKQMNLPEGLQYGLIADEVQQVVPGAVKKITRPADYENHDEKKGKKLSEAIEFNAVNYMEMIPILISAVKEQQAIISNQDKKMADMQKQIDDMKASVKK